MGSRPVCSRMEPLREAELRGALLERIQRASAKAALREATVQRQLDDASDRRLRACAAYTPAATASAAAATASTAAASATTTTTTTAASATTTAALIATDDAAVSTASAAGAASAAAAAAAPADADVSCGCRSCRSKVHRVTVDVDSWSETQIDSSESAE